MAIAERIYPISESISASQLAGVIQQMVHTEVNGCITVSTDAEQQWSLYFSSGHVIWASGGEHRWRRWYRLLKQLKIHPKYLPKLQRESPRLEYDVLTELLDQGRITRKSMQFAVDAAVNEVLFDIFLTASIVIQISCDSNAQELLESPVTVLGSYEEAIARAHSMMLTWQTADLGWYSPNWAPLVNEEVLAKQRRSLPKVHQRFLKLLNGKRSIRDLALKTGKDLEALSKVLTVYMRQDFIRLQAIPDRRSPCVVAQPKKQRQSLAALPPASAAASDLDRSEIVQDDRLILCIDDSEHVCYMMEEILKQAGYRVMTVQEAVEAVSLVLRQSPDLIFLDLLMPVVNGYELCKQIRRVSIFKNVPIVILTSKDGMLERVHAKMVGATDFLSKPVDETKILETLQRHLPPVRSKATHDSNPQIILS